MPKDSPRVSILMTIYNAGSYLRLAVDSLLSQSFTDWELVAIENGSTDGSKQVMAGYSDPRIRLIDLDKNIGRTPALNLALREAKGDLVAILDADDIALPLRLEQQVAFMDANPKVVLLGGWARLIDGEGHETGAMRHPSDPAALKDSLIYSNPVMHSASMYRREAALKGGGYPEAYAYASDFGLWLDLLKQGEMAVLAEDIVLFREHAASATVSPVFALAKARDGITLFKAAAALWDYSPKARHKGRLNMARYKGYYAMALWRKGQKPKALAAFAASFALAPSIYFNNPAFRRMTGLWIAFWVWHRLHGRRADGQPFC